MTLTKKQQEECDRMFKEWYEKHPFKALLERQATSGGYLDLQISTLKAGFEACYSIMIQRLEEKNKEIERLKETIRVYSELSKQRKTE